MEPRRFDSAQQVVGIGRDRSAEILPARPDPPVPVDGLTIGLASMATSAPHGGEMHPDGDEVLLLVSGSVRVHLETDPPTAIPMGAGDGMIVPRGTWHRVEVVEPCQIVYATPGPGFELRPPRSA